MNKLTYRREYNKRKLELQRSQHATLEAFKAANPERYAELIQRVHTKMNVESAVQPTFTGRSIHGQISSSRQQEAENRVHELVKQIHAGKRDWIIHTKDKWGDEHTLFLGFPREHVPQPGDKVKTPIKGEEYTVLDAIPCTCPLCK